MKNASIGTKLYLALGSLVTIAVALALCCWWTLNTMRETTAASNSILHKQVLIGSIDSLQSSLYLTEKTIEASALENRWDNIPALDRSWNDEQAKLERAFEDLNASLITGEGRRMCSTMQEAFTSWKKDHDAIVQAVSAKVVAELVRLTNQDSQYNDTIERTATLLTRQQGELLKAAESKGESSQSLLRVIGAVLMLLAVFAGAAAVVAVRSSTRQLRQLAGAMTDSSDQVAAASTQVSSSSQALAQGASEQAASLEETSASAEEITSMTRRNADHSRQAASLMTDVERHVSDGNRTLNGMLASMQQINESSEKVSRIIRVIDEIAFQTNILALNAAVEAARAGEAGMGFAVVADEVRNLAQRSAQAAKDTAALIEESITSSREGSTRLEEVAGVIRSITTSATQVKTLVDEVKLGSEEQARGIEQIAKAISQMDKVTQQTAANAEEGASASEELSAQADSMRDTAGRLQAMVGGTQSSARRTHSAARQLVARQEARPSKPALVPAVPQKPVAPGDENFNFDDFKDF